MFVVLPLGRTGALSFARGNHGETGDLASLQEQIALLKIASGLSDEDIQVIPRQPEVAK